MEESSLLTTYLIHLSRYQGIDISSLFDEGRGYAIVPLPHNIIDEFDVKLFLEGQREYVNSNPNQLFVLGGFQAMGNPSSFHHPERRRLMTRIYNFVAPLLAEAITNTDQISLADKDYAYLSMIPDRFAVRRSDQQMGAETWHKDKSMKLEQSKNSFLLGGWVNLDKSRAQHFSCIPGDYPSIYDTHNYYQSQLGVKGGGFTSENIPNAEQRKVLVEIPPYHMIIFNELLTHEVVKGPSKRKYEESANSYRCYIKWYISSKNTPYWDAERFSNFIEDQTQIGTSYFQPDAAMYATAHVSTAIPSLQAFSQQFIPEVKNFQFKDSQKYAGSYLDRFIGQGNEQKPDAKGTKKRKGLKDWGLEFEEYTQSDLSIYIPRRIYLS